MQKSTCTLATSYIATNVRTVKDETAGAKEYNVQTVIDLEISSLYISFYRTEYIPN